MLLLIMRWNIFSQGKNQTVKNLKGETKVLALRGSMNLLYLLNSPIKRRKQSAGKRMALQCVTPSRAQMAVSFLILTLWAFGEAVLDVRHFWPEAGSRSGKRDATWKTGLSGLLDQSFLGETAESGQDGRTWRIFELHDVLLWTAGYEISAYGISSSGIFDGTADFP